MLARLALRNYLFVKHLTIDFSGGFGVLTGETGAGKSLLVGALALLAGARPPTARVHKAATTAEIEAVFSLSDNTEIRDWLQQHALSDGDGDEVLLARRVIGTEKRKSAAFINGRQVPLAQLAEGVSQLMDICGQHAHYSLREVVAHRQLLDAVAGANPAMVADVYHAWKDADTQWRNAEATAAENAEKQATLGEALDELEALDFSSEKWRQMNDELTRMANITDLADGCAQSLEILAGDANSVQSALARVYRLLNAMQRHDGALSATNETLSSAADLLNEVARDLSLYAERLSADPAALAQAEAFVADCHRLARKHGLQAADLLGECITEKREQLRRLADVADCAALQKRAQTARRRLDTQTAALSSARRRVAKKFADEVNGYLQKLAMPNARLTVLLTPLDAPTATGAEKVEFQISTRPQMPPAAIASVASGGELSRLGLAIHLAAKQTRLVTIFDEVDAGIGGATAGVVGALLRDLGGGRQVLCVTHLPQVAAAAVTHWRVTGGEDLSVTQLSAVARVEEIARMHSGEKITATARRHAKEMLTTANAR